MGYSPCNFTLFHFFVKTFKTTTFSDRKSVSRYYFCTTNQSVVHGVSLPVLSSKRGDDRKGIGLLIWPGLQTGVQRCIASCWPINTETYTLFNHTLSFLYPPPSQYNSFYYRVFNRLFTIRSCYISAVLGL